jgi:CheY-like chemotaxis protein
MAYNHIMYIDDDEDDIEIFRTALSLVSDGVECTTYVSGVDALRDLEQRIVEPDVIFIDLNMPVMTGQEFLVEIKDKEELASIPVIVYSTTSHAATIELTKELGANHFITKHDSITDLVTELQELIN